MEMEQLAALVPGSPALSESVAAYTITDFNRLLTVITTRPGLTMRVHDMQLWCEVTRKSGVAYRNDMCIDYRIQVTNTYRPDNELDAHMHQGIPQFVQTVEDFFDFCLGIALWFDEHEGREWFKLNGKPYRDPHCHPVQTFDPERQFRFAKSLLPQRVSYSPQVAAQMGAYASGAAGGSGYGFAGGG